MNLKELNDLDVTLSMKSTAEAIDRSIDLLSIELREGEGSATAHDLDILKLINRKLLEVDEAFDRPLDVPKIFVRLKKMASVAGQAELESYCTEQVNMIEANELHFRGYTWLYFGDCVNASKYLRQAAELAPKHPLAATDLQTAEKRLAKAEESLAKAEAGLEKKPDKADLWLKKANALVALGRTEDALPDFDRAIELDPEGADALGKKGAALEGLGKFDEAVGLFNRALDIKPTSQIAKKGLNLAEYFTENP